MTAAPLPSEFKKQHLIDPEICIRCNTCEATCPVGAVTHDDANYVVDAAKCNYCMDCIGPCPTGSIDNWRIVTRAYAPRRAARLDRAAAPGGSRRGRRRGGGSHRERGRRAAGAGARRHRRQAGGAGLGVQGQRQHLHARQAALATVQGNYRITAQGASSDVRHIVLSFGDTIFPVLEGQSIGIVPPGIRPDGRPHDIRLYSIASARDGEKRNANNLSLTVKRTEGGVASNYLCTLKVGDKVQVTGPFGATFLMPDDPSSNILMICTGTGSAPFRAFTERRRRAAPGAPGRMLMYFGARAPEELPYFGPLQKVPQSLLDKQLVFSRLPGQPKEYVQHRMRTQSHQIGDLLQSEQTHVFICGLKGMEEGVDDALKDICQDQGVDWAALKPHMRAAGRYHVETY